MAKPVNLSIQFRLPKGTKRASAKIKPFGEIVFTDEEGKEVVPEYMDRAIHYDRPKGPKVQGRHKLTNDLATIGGLTELVQYDSIFVIDTNTKKIEQGPVSVACFICCRLVPEGEKFRVECEGQLNIYEFHNVGGNPELLSILKVANDVLNSKNYQGEHKFAIVTDTELNSHDSINSRTTPIYGPHCLPGGFTLLYASSDTGQEVLNRLIRFCDREAANYFSHLEKGTVKDSEFRVLSEDSSVKYRYMFRDDLEIVNPVVGGVSIGDGTKISLYGVKSKQDHRGPK